MVGENGEALLTPEEIQQQAYLDLTEEELQQRRQEQFYYHPQTDSAQLGQQDYQLGAVRQAVEEAMPGVYEEIDKIRASENEEERKKVLHHARGTSLFMQDKQVLEIDLASPGFKAFRAPHHGLSGNEDSAAAKARYGVSINKGKSMRKRRTKQTADGSGEVDKARYQMSAVETTDEKGNTGYDHKDLRTRVKEMGQRYLRGIFEGWDAGLEKTEVCVILRGYDHGGIAAAESAMILRYWISTVNPDYLDYVKFELVQHDPVEQNAESTETPIDLYSENDEEIFERDGERMMPLGKSAETTVFYSLTGSTMPQSIRGAKRMILTAGNAGETDMTQKDGAHRAAMTDSKTGEVYRGSGINELAAGVYLMDESRTLVQVQNYEQAVLILSKLLPAGEEEKRRRVLLDALKSWFGVQADMTEEESAADEARGDLMLDVKQIPFSDGKDSPEMTAVKTAMVALRPLLDKAVGDGGGLVALQAAYAELIGRCSHYVKKKNPWTASGKRRLQMVKTIQEQTLREQELLGSVNVTEMADMTWRLAIHTLGAQAPAPQGEAAAPKTAARKKHTGRISRKAIAGLRSTDIAGEAERRQMRDFVKIRRQLRTREEQLAAAKELGCEEQFKRIIMLVGSYVFEGVLETNRDSEHHRDRRKLLARIEEFKQEFGNNPQIMALLEPYLPAFALPEQGRLDVDLSQVPAEQKVNGKDEQLMPKMEWRGIKDVQWDDRSKIPLFEREPSIHDVRQGMVGDCYFLASIANIVKTNPNQIREMMRDNGDGTVTVRFFKQEKAAQEGAPPTFSPLYVTVQKTVLAVAPGGSGEPSRDLMAQNNLWVQMLEKAWAVSGLHNRERHYDEKKDTFRGDPDKIYETCKEQVQKEADAAGRVISAEELKAEAKARYYRSYAGVASGFQDESMPAFTGQAFQRINLQMGDNGVYDPVAIGVSVRNAMHDSGKEDWQKEMRLAIVAKLERKVSEVQRVERRQNKINTSRLQKPMTIDRLKQLWREMYQEDQWGILSFARYYLEKNGFKVKEEVILQEMKDMEDLMGEVLEKAGYFYHAPFSTKTDPETGEQVGNYTEAAMETYNRIREALDAGRPVGVGTLQFDDGEGSVAEKRKDGLAGGHAYSVIGCQEQDGFRYVLVRNPWSAYSRGYEKIVDEDGREHINVHAKDETQTDDNGYSLVELNDFVNHFGLMYIQAS